MKAAKQDLESVQGFLPGDHAVEKRARAELALKAERVQPIVPLLHMTGLCAVVAAEGASLEDFREGLAEKIGRNKRGEEKVLWLPANGNIQNAGKAPEKETLQAISTLRRASGFVVLGFEGVDFKATTDINSNRITRRLGQISGEQDTREAEDAARKRRLGQLAGKYIDKHRRDFGIVFLGTGDAEDLIPTIHYAEEGAIAPQLLSVFAPRFALLETGELAVEFPVAPEPVQDESSGPSQLELDI